MSDEHDEILIPSTLAGDAQMRHPRARGRPRHGQGQRWSGKARHLRMALGRVGHIHPCVLCFAVGFGSLRYSALLCRFGRHDSSALWLRWTFATVGA